MPFTATVVRVLIASPSDVIEERKALREAIWRWNDEHASTTHVVLLPIGWETHSRPELGDHPQALIDRQVVADTDVVIGVFWTRLGTPTPDADSGTVHEIQHAQEGGKHVLLYFSNRPVVPESVDPDQLRAVHKFKKEAQSWGLIDTFDAPADLLDKARGALLRLVREKYNLGTETPGQGQPRSGVPRIVAESDRERRQKVDSRGRFKESTHHYLNITNVGDAAARGVRASWVGGEGPRVHDLEKEISDLPAGSSVRLSVLLTFGSPSGDVLELQWRDDAGHDYSERQTIRF